MTLRNLGRTLLLCAGAAGMALGLTSCSNDHTVGYIYVLGTQYNQINVFREDNNNGSLVNVTAPLPSGGSDPIRAVTASSRFLYVLNAGTATTGTVGSGTSVTGYTSSNVTLFTIGGYGQISQQLQYSTPPGQGLQRIAVNAAGTFLFVLNEYAPPVATTDTDTTPPISVTADPTTGGAPTGYPCQDRSDPTIYHPEGGITVYSIDGSTGRLQVQLNQRQQGLSYFQVGCYPTDFRVTASYVYTMDAGSTSNGDLNTVNVQAVSGGQLTPTQVANAQVPAGPTGATPAIEAVTGDNANKYVYLLDTTNNLIYLYTIGTNGALTAISGSPYTNSSVSGGPIQSIVDSTGKYFYAIDGGGTAGINSPQAEIGGYSIDATTGIFDNLLQDSPTNLSQGGTVSNPVCIFEDPTNQFIYVAGSADNSITGRRIDPNTGVLSNLNGTATFPTVGTPSWCLGISSEL